MRGIRSIIITGAALLSLGVAGAASASASASTPAPRTVLACGAFTATTPHARVSVTAIRADDLRCGFSVSLVRAFVARDTTVASCAGAVSAYRSCAVEGYSCKSVGRSVGARIPITCSAGLRSVKFYEAETSRAA